MSTVNESFSIAPPEPDLTPHDLLERARALRPLLLQEQAATEERTAPALEVHQAIYDAGLYRVVQPRRFGGYEFSLVDYCRCAFEIARGCPSTGWYYSFNASHPQILAEFFSEQAQIDHFGPDGDFLAPGRAPMGKGTPVDGGYLIDGKWDYCSGSAYSTHFMAGFIVPVDDGPPSIGMAIVPQPRYTVLDDWGDTLGLRGTASNSIVVENELIPDHWISWYNQIDVDLTVPPPGWEIHHNPQYAGKYQQNLLLDCAAWAVGTALGMLDEYEALTGADAARSTQVVPRYERADFERYYGVAHGLVETAAGAVLDTARTHVEISQRALEGGEPYSPAEDRSLKIRHQRAIEMCWEAAELLFRTSGTHALKNDSRMQRHYRDLAMGTTHVFMQIDSHAAEFGHVALGPQ